MDMMEVFNVVGNLLATGPVTPADIIVGLAAWAAVGVMVLVKSRKESENQIQDMKRAA